MTTQTLTCPYCNASLGIQAGWSAGQRIVCPRCGDSFPLRLSDSFTDQPPSARPTETGITANPPAPEVSLPSRWSNRLIAGIVLGVMFVMAGGGLVFMLMTQEQRRGYDTSRPPRRPGRQRSLPEQENVPPPVASVAPDKLAALGYLPSGVNLLFAARFPELLASPLGAQVLRNPISLGGQTPIRLEKLPEGLGFRLEDIDHFVFAVRMDDVIPPVFYAVFRTTQPYDEAQLRQRLKCKRVASRGEKAIYSYRTPSEVIGELKTWFADTHTVVLSLYADNLERLPSQPIADLQQFPTELRMMLKERREPVAPAWIAGHSRDWSKTWAVMFLEWKKQGEIKKEELEKLASLRTFGIFLVPTLRAGVGEERGKEDLVVNGVFACKDEPRARGIEQYFRSLRGPDADFKTALDGPWLTLQFHTNADFLARLIRR